MPRYTLTDEELLAIQQDQIDHEMREEARLAIDLGRANADDSDAAEASKYSAVKKRLDRVQASLAQAKAKAEEVEGRMKAAGKPIPQREAPRAMGFKWSEDYKHAVTHPDPEVRAGRKMPPELAKRGVKQPPPHGGPKHDPPEHRGQP